MFSSVGGYRHLGTQQSHEADPEPRNLPRVYRHSTLEVNLPSIRRDGLEPGHHPGIGYPGDDTRKTACTDGVYVVEPGGLLHDEQGESVAVFSTKAPDDDLNYDGGCGKFSGPVPPLREASNLPMGTTFSSVMPMSPDTATGAAHWINRLNPSRSPVGPSRAAELLGARYSLAFPLHAPRAELSSLRSPAPVSSGDIPPGEDQAGVFEMD